MPTAIVFTAEKLALKGTLDDSETAQTLAARLPLTVRMSRWGDEYYGNIGPALGVREAADARSDMQVGELAYWIPGNAVCLFFGPTPASSGPQPRAASAVNPVGRLDGPFAELKALGDRIQATVKRAD